MSHRLSVFFCALNERIFCKLPHILKRTLKKKEIGEKETMVVQQKYLPNHVCLKVSLIILDFCSRLTTSKIPP